MNFDRFTTSSVRGPSRIGAASGASAAAPAPAPARDRTIHVLQGQFHVTDDPSVMLATILGSCVAACIRDPVAGIGGLNHFLLPDGGSDRGAGTMKYGVHAMELLINGILREGGRRERLTAKLFGGARMASNLPDIGRKNADFGVEFLRREGICYEGGSLLGHSARRLQFWPVSGRVRQGRATEAPEQSAREFVPHAPEPQNDVELF